jgi:hippurate hydrolase
MPDVKVDPGEFTPAMYNDPSLTRRVVKGLKQALGSDQVIPQPPVMGGEDFSRYGKEGIPICMLRLGTVPPARLAEANKGGRPLPSLHSDLYYPIPEPSIKTGVHALSVAVLDLLARTSKR